MRQNTVEDYTVMRGNREYVEIEGSNQKFESIKKHLKNYNAKELSKENTKILYDFLTDLEKGKYTSKNSRKGGRSPKRLVRLFYSIRKIVNYLGGVTLTEITEEKLEKFFDELNKDKIKKANGEPYKDKRDFKRDFSSFWHWHMVKTYKEQKTNIPDITEYITTPRESKPKFVFFTLEDLRDKILTKTNNEDLRAVLLILFDMGARPSEFFNIRRKDVSYSESDKKFMVEIPEEISKTFGRKIKLWISSTAMKNYLNKHNFESNDLLFIKKRNTIKKFFQDIHKDKEVKNICFQYEKTLSLYDFRHSSSCYYLNKYPTAKDMKYRFGWKKEDKIEYYTHFLGKQDFLSEEDMLTPEDKTKLEKELAEQRKANQQLSEQMSEMKKQFQELHDLLKKGDLRVA